MTALLATFADSNLIRLALAGQTECFAVLIDRHKGAVRRRIASMVGSPADADDTSGRTTESVASPVGIPVGIQLSYVDDSCGY